MVTALHGFNQSLTLSCAGLPVGASCSFSAPVVQSNGTSTIPLTINTRPGANVSMVSDLERPIYASIALGFIFWIRRRKRLGSHLLQLGNSHFNGDRVRGACRLRRSDQADGEHCDNYRAISNGSGAHDDAKADSLLIRYRAVSNSLIVSFGRADGGPALRVTQPDSISSCFCSLFVSL